MQTFTVTSHFSRDVDELFHGYGGAKVLPQDYEGMSFDLAVLTGGSDINPEMYGETCGGRYDDSRDKREFDFLHDIFMGKVKVKKVLGICRGLQMMNIAFGGSLILDIYDTFGASHKYAHPIEWIKSTAFTPFLKTVNSMHHQGILSIGENMRYKVLGKEPETGVIEMIMWGDEFLATQFHPELMPDFSPEKRMIADVIAKWVNGEISIIDGPVKSAKKNTASWAGSWSDGPPPPTIDLSVDISRVHVDWSDTNEESEEE